MILLLLILGTTAGFSQDDRRRKNKESFNQAVALDRDKLPYRMLSDSAKAAKDSARVADSLFRADSIELQKNSSLDAPAFTTARDSVVEVFENGQRKAYYYGDVTVTYGDLKLTADFMEYDMTSNMVYAKGTLDTLTGETIGLPKMIQGKDTYQMEEVWYNFDTKKAKITNMVTRQDDGLLHGESIKMMPDKSINIKNGKYTVCDLEEPHYFMRMYVAKVITKPTQKTVFGPSWPNFEGVPLPIGVPFGFVPKKPNRATGLLTPTFGEETARGFYLRDFGMYFVIGDHFDISATADYYTMGSWALNINSRYKYNYKSNGNFSFTYSNDVVGEKGSNDYNKMTNMAIRWSHSQDSKAHPGTTFSASVNFSSPGNNRYNSTSVQQALQNQASSSISWSRNWNGKFNLSVNALHSQNSRDSSYAFTLPNLTFSVNRFYPFKQKVRVGKEKIYEKISFGYNTAFQNKVNFNTREFNEGGLDTLMTKMQNGMTHNFQIGLPNFTVLKYLNFTPSVSYSQNWYFKKRDYFYNEETGKVEFTEGKAMSDFGISQTYAGSMSMSTRLYGTFNFGVKHRVQAIRHVITPSMSLSISPEKGLAMNGYHTLTYNDRDGVEHSYPYNIYSGQMYSPPGKGKSATASISIGNNIEAKVRDLRDTTGKGVKKIKIIDQLNFSTGYNFLADSMKMNPIGVTMSTSIFGKLNVSANANFDPYAINERGQRIKEFNIAREGGLNIARLTGASASLSYSISGKGAVNGNDGSKNGLGGGVQGSGSEAYYKRVYYHPLTGEYIPGGWIFYANPDVPWSLNMSYSFSYNKTYQYTNNELITNNNFTQTLNLNGNIKLTPRLSMNASSGFDIMAFKITTTQFSFSYDLHCFNISASWVPSGKWQSWNFRIGANASALADLLQYKKSTSYWDRGRY